MLISFTVNNLKCLSVYQCDYEDCAETGGHKVTKFGKGVPRTPNYEPRCPIVDFLINPKIFWRRLKSILEELFEPYRPLYICIL